MKKLAVSSLSLALGLGGFAAAQSPFMRSGPQNVVPVAAVNRAPNLPPGGVVPVRVHFGGALTRDGIVPVPVYLHLNQQSGHRVSNQPPGVIPATMSAPGVGSDLPASAVGKIEPVRHAKTTETAALAAASCYEDVGAVPGHVYTPPSMDQFHRPGPEPCGHRFYTTAEYLTYKVKPQESPPLLVSGIGGIRTAEEADNESRHGGRFVFGWWLPCPCPNSLEVVFMFLGERDSRDSFRSAGFPGLGRPFIDSTTGLPAVLPLADLDVQQGSSRIEASGSLFSFEVNWRRELCRKPGGHIDFLMGYRQLHLDETLTISDETRFATLPVPLSDAVIRAEDHFGTHNRIFGTQVGLEAELNWHRFFVDVWGKFAIGGNAQTANVNGFTIINAPPAPVGDVILPGNVLTQPSNIGTHRAGSFTVIPEAGINVGFRIMPNWRIAAGYNVIFINNVLRPGDAIDPTVNPSFIPQLLLEPGGAQRPTPQMRESTYYAHGLNVQMEVRY